jgi:sulfur relay (sulfurtransferase) complex TusBCD TusD component (DsrE family)
MVVKMACLVANFATKQECLTSLKDYTKPDTTSCSTRAFFDNLKDLGVLETTKGSNNTICISACLARGLRNKEN